MTAEKLRLVSSRYLKHSWRAGDSLDGSRSWTGSCHSFLRRDSQRRVAALEQDGDEPLHDGSELVGVQNPVEKTHGEKRAAEKPARGRGKNKQVGILRGRKKSSRARVRGFPSEEGMEPSSVCQGRLLTSDGGNAREACRMCSFESETLIIDDEVKQKSFAKVTFKTGWQDGKEKMQVGKSGETIWTNWTGIGNRNSWWLPLRPGYKNLAGTSDLPAQGTPPGLISQLGQRCDVGNWAASGRPLASIGSTRRGSSRGWVASPVGMKTAGGGKVHGT